MSKLVAVTFLMSYTVGTLYAKGETAGFLPEVADDLIEREIAEPASDEEPSADPERDELNKLTKKELVELAAKEEIEVDDGLNKGPLIDAIIAGRAA